MSDFFSKLFDTSDFPARWDCGNWDAGHGWLHIGSDLAIFGAYFAIPIAIIYYLGKKRTEVTAPGLFLLFSAFIFSCGATHLVEATIFYNPIYRFSGLMKLITAIVSWATVIVLIRLLPRVLELPGLRRANELLAERNLLHEKTAAELERSNRELGEFTSLVKHDLRNPVSSALFMAELAKESVAGGRPEELPERLDLIVSTLHEMDEMVSRLHERSSTRVPATGSEV